MLMKYTVITTKSLVLVKPSLQNMMGRLKASLLPKTLVEIGL